MVDPDTAPLAELDRELARLQRQYRVASHEVGSGTIRLEGIPDAIYRWWMAAHRAAWARRFDRNDTPPTTATVEQVELRKERLRKPQR